MQLNNEQTYKFLRTKLCPPLQYLKRASQKFFKPKVHDREFVLLSGVFSKRHLKIYCFCVKF